MLQLIQNNKKKIGLSILLIVLLALVRLFENQLFYDPFLKYYESEFAHMPFPKYNIFKLFFSIGMRFYVNTVLSLFLLYVIFNDTKIVKFSMLLYMVLGSLLMISFIFVLVEFGEHSKWSLFYIRRFLIQPIFVILFIPGFYYQKKSKLG